MQIIYNYMASKKMADKLEWEDMYSVDVEQIDNQHKRLFEIINELAELLNINASKTDLNAIIDKLMEYKKFHFATEEKYFKDFDYEKTDEHISSHRSFDNKIKEIKVRCGDDFYLLGYELIDFLEDWLIGHLMTADQEYKACFKAHGLK